MAKAAKRFACQDCGASYAKWLGKCEACGAWNSITEETALTQPGRKSGSKGRVIELHALVGSETPPPRMASAMAEFDRVTGGGLVPGSALLLGGDPGIGKSTLLLQVLAALAKNGHKTAYFSGEEAVDQVRLRARRLGLGDLDVGLANATAVEDIAATLDQPECPDVVVVDSVQTLYHSGLDSAPGTVAQVRWSAQILTQIAKRRGFALFLIGHVTKDGMIAGPKVLEHMVDAVLTLEGERTHHFRILRASKNRFGPAQEIGVFEMSDRGMEEVANPSALFLGNRKGDVPGTAVFAGLEGTRPVLVEVQALVSPSPLATPRRAVVGWDTGRLAMVLAVLEARCGLSLSGVEVYLNMAGGLRVQEPAADLAAAAALVSAATNQPLAPDTVYFGEIGLTGEVRAVAQTELRLKEAAKLGFKRARTALPRHGDKRQFADLGIEIIAIEHLSALLDQVQD